jgi:hypothetical protein
MDVFLSKAVDWRKVPHEEVVAAGIAVIAGIAVMVRPSMM